MCAVVCVRTLLLAHPSDATFSVRSVQLWTWMGLILPCVMICCVCVCCMAIIVGIGICIAIPVLKALKAPSTTSVQMMAPNENTHSGVAQNVQIVGAPCPVQQEATIVAPPPMPAPVPTVTATIVG